MQIRVKRLHGRILCRILQMCHALDQSPSLVPYVIALLAEVLK